MVDNLQVKELVINFRNKFLNSFGKECLSRKVYKIYDLSIYFIAVNFGANKIFQSKKKNTKHSTFLL